MASGSLSSEGWECVFEGDDCQMSEIDNAFLMAFLEDAQGEEAEDERLSCVIRSLEAEICPDREGGSGHVTPQSDNYEDSDDCGLENVGSEDNQSFLRSPCHVEDPFNWAEMDMDMVSNSPGNEVDNWYLDTCMDEIEIVNQFGGDLMNGDGMRDYTSLYYLDASIEQAYSPLWQENVRY